MGIANAEHLATHPARRALFENLVISEHQKHRFNQRLASNLYFWCNNTEEEVGLVLEEGAQLQPIKIKSGQTLHASFLERLHKWAR